MQLFRQSIITTQCDRCRRVLSLSRMGVCAECREVLCDADLHGSLVQRLRVSLFGVRAVCTRCRAAAVAGD
jgi:hypothetical protein